LLRSLRRRGIDLRLAVVAAALWAVQAVITVFIRGADDYERAESMAPVEWQQAFAEALSGLPGDGAALLPGLTLGDTSSVDHGLTAAMRVASLTHLTAVSGANCAIVTVAVIGLAALIGFPRWARVVASDLTDHPADRSDRRGIIAQLGQTRHVLGPCRATAR
jgi:hypothetical protein